MQKATVLITTHYIEETRFSNKVGIMRNGRMLIEGSPQTLLSTFNTDFLQGAILKICKRDQELQQSSKTKLGSTAISISGSAIKKSTIFPNEIANFLNTRRDSILQTSMDSVTFKNYREIDPDEMLSGNDSNSAQICIDCSDCNCKCKCGGCDNFAKYIAKSLERTTAFSTIMWIYLVRQPIFAFILLLMPAMQLLMTFSVIGKEPVNLNVGVINFEQEHIFVSSSGKDFNFCWNSSYREENICNLEFLSCRIIENLSHNGKLVLERITNASLADKMLEQGSIFGYVVFPYNYSLNLVNRHFLGKFADDNETLDGSKLTAVIDKSHYLAYHLILKEIANSLEKLSEQLKTSCGFDNRLNEIPLKFREPVYGRLDGTHQDSIMPAIVTQILFEILYGIAPMILIKDLKQGTFERASLAGLCFSEFMLGIFMTISPILIAQSISCYFVLENAFSFGVRGHFLIFMLLCILSGLCGQGFGIFMGILVKSEFAVIVSAIMVIPIIMTCSGTLWPLEAHPHYLKIIYYIFPSAPIVSSLRSVINRGVGLTHSLVWPGFLNAVLWSIIFWLLSIYKCKRMSKM